jgi:hypothetical protein
MRRAFLSLMSTAFLCLNLTSVASAVNIPSDYVRQAAIISIDHSDWYNVGVRSHLTTSTYQTPPVDGAGQAFWVGELLSDNSAYQVGIKACGSQCLEWFAQAFDKNGTLVLDWTGPTTTPGYPTYHDVAIQMAQSGFEYDWYPTFDGARADPNSDFWTIAPNSGTNGPQVVAELSLHPQGPMPDPNSMLGPLTATNQGTGVKAMQTKIGTTWRDTLHADAWFLNQVCPPINVYGWGYQSASMGNFAGHACAVDFNRLGNW